MSTSLCRSCCWILWVWLLPGLACDEQSERTPGSDDTSLLDPENASPWHCGDGEDNDLDGLTDCEDADCASSSFCNENIEDGDCADGLDPDEDGQVDCEDPACSDASECEEDDGGCDESDLEIDTIGPGAPRVGDEWTVWLRCDGSTLIGAMVLRFDPLDFASVAANQVTFLSAGTAEMTVQVGAYRSYMDVTVTD